MNIAVNSYCSYLRQNFKHVSSIILTRHYSMFSSDQKLISQLQSCKQISEIKQFHALMVKTGQDQIPFSLSKLLACSIQYTDYASSMFKYIQSPNLYMYNTMLRSYSISDDPQKGLLFFNNMRAQSVILDQFAFVSGLRSCTRLLAKWTGEAIHSVVLRSGFDLPLDLRNTLLNFYCVSGRIRCAHQLFDEFSDRDLVSWNTLMGGYLCVHNYPAVLELFIELHRDGVSASATTMLCVLSAIGELKIALVGESMHGFCIKNGFCYSVKVLTALISLYGKMGCISSGRSLFDEAYPKDVVLWNCLIDGYAKNGLLEEALSLLRQMKVQRLKPNSSTLAGLLSASASSGAFNMGHYIQNFTEDQQLAMDPVLGTALIDMYAKSGLLVKAVNVFDNMETKDVKCWTSMIMGYGVHGEAKDAVALFHRMEDEGFRPNEVTFLAVFNACSHGGLVAEGISCFRKMVLEYGLTPKIEHYGCLIDILGRAGLLETARELIKGLPIEGDATAWRALLAACRVHASVELGEQVKKELEQRFGKHPADSLLLSSTYAIAGIMPEHRDITEVEERKLEKEVECSLPGKKEAGCSAIELCENGQVFLNQAEVP
ncbi:pentatricopeptide repeat-containing protein At1g26900, mitochondrial [Nicotiana tomentosiformis]|uniref:pentatricopeptide repeat-containing protein At1g26900, mitochondrial n=1 Tax=Nicotiana tomentosiformis TaxID=4098 RepID=UPI00051C6460|nr:pentatricopeptide repeat-containing protein At1g26900, mitochondrial [Nicotiana tomentosiformis]XP_018627146.1 pentatricopeptide repeat-containing protein At1g26900, mitochondrial [Nicotiana tomentosiformis]XP_033512670.1 pentatricopeptide repeat-containing protein At1g26900, mitochondrial [Nicotiana tomentosiformis]